MNKRLRLALGAIFFALMFFYLGMRVYTEFVVPNLMSRRGWNAEQRDGKVVVTVVGDHPSATPVLRGGDEIVALSSDRASLMPLTTPTFWRVPAGTRYTLTIRREGEIRELALYTTVFGEQPGVLRIVFLLTLLLSTVTGLTVLILKPPEHMDKQAWLLALILGSMAALYPHSYNSFTVPVWAYALMLIANVVSLIFIPAFLHFFLIFPENSPLLRRWPRLETWPYLLFGLLILPLYVLRIVVFNLVSAPWLTNLFNQGWLNRFLTVTIVLCLVCGLISMLINYRAAGPAARRRLRVVMAGSGAGFLNLLLMPLGEMLHINQTFPAFWRGLDVALIFTLPLIPLSFAYAIVKHQVIPVSLIIRRGVRYVLVSRGSVLLEVIAVTLAVTALLTFVFSRMRPSGLVIGIVSAATGIVAWKFASRLHDKFLAPVIDRRFFRQSYDSQQILADLADSLRTTTSLSQLTEHIATKIQSALQTESVAVLLRDEATGDYLSDYSCEYSAGEGRAVASQERFRLPRFAETAGKLAETRQPIEVELNGSHSIESDALRQMKSSLLLPLAGKDGMPGIISLGPRLGDVPYSREDKRLLMSVAGPTTFAIENARLVERMIEEARRREEIEAENEARAKELEEARQLQLSMLPKRLPELPGLEIAAYMKTATEVGGDYYDFHLGGDGTLTVVVGDATGHGLKAGTIVTATKSLLNHLVASPDIPAIFQQSSRALKQMNLRGLFMAMTMVKLNGSRLTIGVAGMPPMLVYRAAERRVEEVSIQAMPLGSLTSVQYGQQQIELSHGDIILLMSDGFPERFNPRGEMLEMAAAADVLLAHAASSPQTIIDALIRAGDQWAAGAAQNDDLTFVVLKLR